MTTPRKKTMFHAGNGDTLAGMNSIDVAVGSQPNGPRTKPLDDVVPKGREMPHTADRGKADEISHADPSMGLGVSPTGVLGGA